MPQKVRRGGAIFLPARPCKIGLRRRLPVACSGTDALIPRCGLVMAGPSRPSLSFAGLSPANARVPIMAKKTKSKVQEGSESRPRQEEESRRAARRGAQAAARKSAGKVKRKAGRTRAAKRKVKKVKATKPKAANQRPLNPKVRRPKRLSRKLRRAATSSPSTSPPRSPTQTARRISATPMRRSRPTPSPASCGSTATTSIS